MSDKLEIEKISDALTRVSIDNKTIILVGTAHVSAVSMEEVRMNIESENPEHVCIELDEGRLRNIEEEKKWSGTDVKNVIRRGQGFMMIASLALTSFQRRLGADMGIQPGAEMKAAIDTCKKIGIPFTCADRSVQVTLSRAWRASGFFAKLKLISALFSFIFSNEKASSEEIENMKNTDVMQGMMSELADYLPSVKTVLIDERDHYLTAKILTAPGKKTLAVVGAAHVPGIIDTMVKISKSELTTDTSRSETIPPKKLIGKVIPWIIPAIIVTLFIVGVSLSGIQKILEMSMIWILANGILASLGALIALAHPLTILVSFIAAPLTSLNPTIGVGMVSGLLEYLFRSPRVMDMENLNTDIVTRRGWYRNRITRVLLVFLLSSIGSSVGTFIAIPWLTRIMGS